MYSNEEDHGATASDGSVELFDGTELYEVRTKLQLKCDVFRGNTPRKQPQNSRLEISPLLVARRTPSFRDRA